MNNKFNIGDKVEATKEAIKGINLIKGIATIISIDEACSNGAKYEIEFDTDINVPYYANDEDLTPYIEEDKVKKKFKKGDKVTVSSIAEVKHGVIFNVNEYDSYDVVIDGEDGFTSYHAEWIELDTQEEMLKFHNDQSIGSSVGQAPVGLDYEQEYNKLLEEHEQTKELLEIAKVALKLTTELISTDD
jgi:hypothetical protein